MARPTLGLRLRDKLGTEAAQDLSGAFEEVENHMLTITTERFEARLAAVASDLRQEMGRMDAGLRITLAEGLSRIRIDLSESRAELMRWSFFFWIGQFSATAAVIGLLWRLANR
jgi:hypothetical protein